MSSRLQVIVLVITVFLVIHIINLLRYKKLNFKYALVWMFVLGVILLFAAFPSLLSWMSKLVGITLPVNMLFFFGIGFALFIIFALSRTVSRLSEEVKKLSQEIAIIRKDMYDKEKKLEEKLEKAE